MELSPGEGVVVGRRLRSVRAPLGEGSSLGAEQPPPRCWHKHGRSGTGREKRGCFPVCTAPHYRGGGEQGEEVTVRQAVAASVTTLQQCGLPGSSAQPGEIAAAHGAGGGALGERSPSCWPGGDGELLPAPAPQECIAAAPASQRTLPSPCSRGLHSLLSLPGCGLWLPCYGSIPIPYPSLSASDLLSGQCS